MGRTATLDGGQQQLRDGQAERRFLQSRRSTTIMTARPARITPTSMASGGRNARRSGMRNQSISWPVPTETNATATEKTAKEKTDEPRVRRRDRSNVGTSKIAS